MDKSGSKKRTRRYHFNLYKCILTYHRSQRMSWCLNRLMNCITCVLFAIDFVKLSTYPEDRLVPPQRGPGARHLHCPDSSVVSSQKPPLLQFKHYFMFFWCWKNSVLLLYSVNGVLLYFHASGLPPNLISLIHRLFCKTEISYFCIFYCGEFDCKLFLYHFWRHLASFFFSFIFFF